MKKDKKVFRVQIGLLTAGMDFPNNDSRIVIAEDVFSALRKVRLSKNCYYSACEITIQKIDKI